MKRFIATTITTLTLYAGGNISMPDSDMSPPEPKPQPSVVQNTTHNENSPSSLYAGLGLSELSIRKTSSSLSFASAKKGQDRVGNFDIIVGYNFSENFDIEGRLGTSLTQGDFSKDTTASLFLKPKIDVNDDITAYALLGVGYTKLNSTNGSNVDAKQTAFQWGLGGQYKIQNNISLFMDYVQLGRDIKGQFLTDNKAYADALTVGILYHF